MSNQEKEEISYMERTYGIKNTEYEIVYFPLKVFIANRSRPSLKDFFNGKYSAYRIVGKIENFSPPTICVRSEEEGLHIVDLVQVIEMHPLLED